ALLRLSEEDREHIERLFGPLQPLVLGDSDALYPTQPVLALGYPLESSSVKATSGVVAGRDFLEQAMIHITAPVNPGNSGGPLFKKDGEVVGINTAIHRNAQNYSYVIPSNDILTVVPDLITKKLVRRHRMGIFTNRTTEPHALSLGNPFPAGVYVNYVFIDSAEYRAGLRQGDMLYELSINGKSFAINEEGDVSVPWRKNEKITLAELFARCRTTDSISLIAYRNGKKLVLQRPLEDFSLSPIRRIHPDCEQEEIDFEIMGGLVCMQLRSNHIESFHTTDSLNSLFLVRDYVSKKECYKQVLVVTHIFPGSQADFSGCFLVGSMLNTVNGESVSTLQELRQALAKSVKSQTITVSAKDDYVTVFDLKKIIEDEHLLSTHFKYTITDTMKKLMQSFKPS
ncbi:trypsin-like peptidase domain-containing protein, partial [Candidatus Dependentiae bacterium]|nr:trypsin-like peptidase domain-containing protein [Candidatus Dependentiae bacterium]